MMKIYIDGQPASWTLESLLKPNFTLRRKGEDGVRAFSYTEDITFTGEDYDYLYSKLVTDPAAHTNTVELRFEDHCCGTPPIVYTFQIKSDTLEWCHGKCELTASASEKSAVSQAHQCLKNTLIANNTATATFTSGFKNYTHPRFSYCNEIRPAWQHHLIMIFGIILGTVLKLFTPIVIIFSAVVQGINAAISAINTLNPGPDINLIGGFDNNANTSLYDEWKAWSNELLLWVIGCGKKHPSPFIRSYAVNVCEQCGLSFQSSIFNNPASQYYNASYHFAPVDKGVDAQDTTTFWIDRNEPFMDGVTFFDKLKTLFNGEWKIDGTVVTFERRDHFQAKTPWLDLTSLSEDEYTICYSWDKKKKPAYGDFRYQKDAVNTVGSEANYRWGCVAGWNQPLPGQNQKGKLQPLLEFNTARFRNDGIDVDVISKYTGALNTAFSTIGGSVNANAFDTALLINQHVTYLPTVLIWDGVNLMDARVNPYFTPTIQKSGVSANQYYNYPMWFFDHGNQAIYGDHTNPENNMYTNFWYIENPRITAFLGLAYEAEVEMTCARLQAMDVDGMIKTPDGTGRIDSIVVDYKENKLIISGVI